MIVKERLKVRERWSVSKGFSGISEKQSYSKVSTI